LLVAEIQARKDFIGVKWADGSSADQAKRPVRLLDYACGTGLVSRALAPFVTQSTGVDIAENMVKQYNENAEKLVRHRNALHPWDRL
jgi:tRNA/tmRNA/rRNA uracil-C5-methylase (TrmA/RlmC/RlmD family)